MTSPQPQTCNCTAISSEWQSGPNTLTISTSFDPGCAICATCTCRPVTFNPLYEDRRSACARLNQSCNFCYPPEVSVEGGSSRQLIQDTRDLISTLNDRAVPGGNADDPVEKKDGVRGVGGALMGRFRRYMGGA